MGGGGLGGSGAAAGKFGFKVGDQRMPRSRKIGWARQASDQRIVGSEETGIECIGSHVQSFSAVKCVEAFLPRHAVGVECPAKIEQQSFDRLPHLRCLRASSRLRICFADIRGPRARPPPYDCLLGFTASFASLAASVGRAKGRPSMKALHASSAMLSRNCCGGLFI